MALTELDAPLPYICSANSSNVISGSNINSLFIYLTASKDDSTADLAASFVPIACLKDFPSI